MSKIEEGLEKIATDMYGAVEGPYVIEDFMDLVKNTYTSMQEYYGDSFSNISEDAVLRVIRQQMIEVIRFKRVHKLLKKRHNISRNK